MKIIYITRDIERALGIQPSRDFVVISNKTPYSENIVGQMDNSQKENVLLIANEKILNTAELLQNEQVQKFIAKITKDNSGQDMGILVFKNTSQIEEVCKKNNWILLNPPASLAEKYENKISQITQLADLKKYLPETEVLTMKDVRWQKRPIVIQWAHGHTGDGTVLVNSEKELGDIRAKFNERIARISPFLNGPSFTVNVIVAKNKILVGNISYQITGLPPFTKNLFSTVGNDWSVTHSLLSDSEILYIENMAREIGEKMKADGWKGLFGIDIIRDNELNQIFLIEINARQPASTTFESYLEQEIQNEIIQSNKIKGEVLTTFEAHLLAIQDKEVDGEIIQINDGAQIIQRVTDVTSEISEQSVTDLETIGYKVISYTNTETNSDLLRIQSKKGIMESHGKLNKRGEEIVKTISK